MVVLYGGGVARELKAAPAVLECSRGRLLLGQADRLFELGHDTDRDDKDAAADDSLAGSGFLGQIDEAAPPDAQTHTHTHKHPHG
jgi:hypothetical protein